MMASVEPAPVMVTVWLLSLSTSVPYPIALESEYTWVALG